MDALISAQAGTALLIQGSDLASIHADSPDKAIPRRTEEAHLLFGEAQDIQILKGVDRDQVVRRLRREADSAEALQLSLILLDPELSGEIRSEAGEELDSLLAEKECREGLERILFAHPLPREADLSGALACSEQAPLAQDLLSQLADLQPAITEVRRAWTEIPDTQFASPADRRRVQVALVSEGRFRAIVLVHRHRGIRLDSHLKEIRANLHEMQFLVEHLVINALITIMDHSYGIGTDAERRDEEVNRLGEKIRDLITRTSVLYHPVASDYRSLIAAMTITNDFEHMGDSAKRICHEFGQLKKHRDDCLAPLCQLVQRTISDCFRSFCLLEFEDVGIAEKTLRGGVDAEKKMCEQALLKKAELGRLSLREFNLQLLAAEELRRIANYAASISDQIVFYNTGRRPPVPSVAALVPVWRDTVALPLTPRETEVLRCLAAAYTDREIAEALGTAEVTVKTHISNILNKFGVQDRKQAVKEAALRRS